MKKLILTLAFCLFAFTLKAESYNLYSSTVIVTGTNPSWTATVNVNNGNITWAGINPNQGTRDFAAEMASTGIYLKKRIVEEYERVSGHTGGPATVTSISYTGSSVTVIVQDGAGVSYTVKVDTYLGQFLGYLQKRGVTINVGN